MDITKKYNQKELTLSVEGRIDTITSKDLEIAIDEEFGNFDSLTMDFTHVNYISSADLEF